MKRSEQEWRELFANHAASGLSAQQFCRANDLCAKHFSLRKKQLARGESAESTFVPVTVSPSGSPAHTTTYPVLVIRHGVSSLCFDAAPNPEWLAQLLRALA